MQLAVTADVALEGDAHQFEQPRDESEDDVGDLKAARGIMLSCMIGLVLWMPIIAGFWIVFA